MPEYIGTKFLLFYLNLTITVRVQDTNLIIWQLPKFFVLENELQMLPTIEDQKILTFWDKDGIILSNSFIFLSPSQLISRPSTTRTSITAC